MQISLRKWQNSLFFSLKAHFFPFFLFLSSFLFFLPSFSFFLSFFLYSFIFSFFFFSFLFFKKEKVVPPFSLFQGGKGMEKSGGWIFNYILKSGPYNLNFIFYLQFMLYYCYHLSKKQKTKQKKKCRDIKTWIRVCGIDSRLNSFFEVSRKNFGTRAAHAISMFSYSCRFPDIRTKSKTANSRTWTWCQKFTFPGLCLRSSALVLLFIIALSANLVSSWRSQTALIAKTVDRSQFEVHF